MPIAGPAHNNHVGRLRKRGGAIGPLFHEKPNDNKKSPNITKILSHIRFFFEIPQKTGPKNKKILKKKEKIVPSYRVIECISL